MNDHHFSFWAAVCKTVRPILSDHCLSVLSVMLVYCGQTVGWIKMKLGLQVGHSPGHTVLDGDPAPPRKGAQQPPHSKFTGAGFACIRIIRSPCPAPPPPKGHSPQFSAHACCGETVGWIKMPLGREIGLGLDHIVLDGDQLPLPQRGTAPQFSPHVYCCQMVAHLNCCCNDCFRDEPCLAGYSHISSAPQKCAGTTL